MEIIGKNAIPDVTPLPAAYFYVQVVEGGKKVRNYLVKADSALDALLGAKEQLQMPVIAVSLTDFVGTLEVPSTSLPDMPPKE